ncbi:MAG: PEGA domain-containing protein [Ignavibacteriales bacterium]|nr:PEGA domain-containing protein [Ignavibacteriales bacterium]
MKNVFFYINLFVGIVLLTLGCEKGDSSTEVTEQQKATLNITSIPSGAVIWIDSAITNQQTPASILVAAGNHLVQLKLSGYYYWAQQVATVPGQSLTINATLQEAPIFEESWETGLSRWSFSDKWSLRTDSVYEGAFAAGYNGYDYPSHDQYWVAQAWLKEEFSLASVSTAWLRFWASNTSTNDLLVQIYISLDGGSSWDIIRGATPRKTWQRFDANLSSFVGPGSTHVKLLIILYYQYSILDIYYNPKKQYANFRIDAITITKQ